MAAVDPHPLVRDPPRGGDPQAHYCCAKLLTITLIAIAVIGLMVGIFAYIVSAGHLVTSVPVLVGLGNIGVANGALLMAGAALLLIFSSIVLACQREGHR